MKIRKWVKIIHRDVGYLAAALTVIYSISGIAVNHINDWNPNYVIENETLTIAPPEDSLSREELVKYIVEKTGSAGEFKNSFKPSPGELEIFLEGVTIKADLNSWIIEKESVNSRTLIRETNFLHLNVPKQVWTYVADLFALALITLAVTGLFILPGKKGIKGRGAWLTAIGLLIPLIFLILYYY